MTFTGIRRMLAALVALVLLGAAASPAAANYRTEEEAGAPVVFDSMFLRPLGYLSLGVGTGLFVVSLPIALMTRPQDIGQPWHILVVRPAKYIWMDPLGDH